MARYPAKLSRNHRSQPQLRPQNQSRTNNNKAKSRNNNRRPQHPVSSIDQQSHQSRPIPNRLAPSTNPVIRIKELSSLEDLLRQAGYKDTRICTPEAEKTRRIKQTFEEEESEEINDLYGTFGLKRKESSPRPLEHRIQNITEPTIPFRSSSAMLRDLALQDIRLADKEVLSTSQQSESWWGGGMAALGRAAKAVIELSPPAKGPVVDDGISSEWGASLIARGESIRKVKSNMELASATPPRNSIPQEQRPLVSRVPTLVGASSPTKPAASISAAIGTPESIVAAYEQPPPVFDEEAFGYGPLPDNYEQCDEEDNIFANQRFEIDSLGSSSRQSSEERATVEEEYGVDDSLVMFGSGQSSQDLDAIGKRVMEGALEYDDEFDTPPKQSIALPAVDTHESTLSTDNRIAETDALPLESMASIVVERPKKYADRATKLRIAKSTPVLRPTPLESSWFGSIRSVLTGSHSTYQALPTEQPATNQAGALWISPTAAAAPTLVTTSTVMCDSASNAAVDLPHVVTRPPSKGAVAAMSLRLRPSMARLREAVGVPARPTSDDDTSPVLSPRLDWDEQGESYAGWGWSARKPKNPSRGTVPATPPKGPLHLKGSIDYTKSFFYKPMTPPQPGPSNFSRPADNQIRARRSIKSLRAALLLPVAAPPVPSIPAQFMKPAAEEASTPQAASLKSRAPVLAIQSPGAWEAGLPPRQLILEGEEWDARDGGLPGDWGRRAIKKSGSKKLKKKVSKTVVS